MRVIFTILFIAATLVGFSQPTTSTTTISGRNAIVTLPEGYSSNPTERYPVIIFYPGLGEQGSNASELDNNGPHNRIMAGSWNGSVAHPVTAVNIPYILISIQPPIWPEPASTDTYMDAILSTYRVDTFNIHVTGLSAGKWAWEKYVVTSLSRAHKIASMVVMSYGYSEDASGSNCLECIEVIGELDRYWWGFEGTSDLRGMDEQYDVINDNNPGNARYTLYSGGHSGWNAFYNETYTENVGGTNMNIYQWMLTHPKPGANEYWESGNTAPVASAGSDQEITLPTATVNLSASASSDVDGTIASYSWAKTSGPGDYSIDDDEAEEIVVSGLIEGVYEFTVTVTDDDGATDTDVVQVTVNAAEEITCDCPPGSGERRTNVITPGSYVISDGADDFMVDYNLDPCDTVVLAAGTYNEFDITNINCIVFINDGQVILNNFNLQNGATNVQLLGNGTPGLAYGIQINAHTDLRFGIHWFATGTLRIQNVEIYNTTIGIQVKTSPEETYPLDYQTIVIDSCYIHDVTLEAIYLGSDELGGPFMDSSKVFDCVIYNSGNDGIQTRNGYFEIYNNDLDNIAINPAFPYDICGILVGGNTTGSKIWGNTVGEVPGNALFINGWGTHEVYCNSFESVEAAIFISNAVEQEDMQSVGFSFYDIHDNILTSNTDNYALSYIFETNGKEMDIEYINNKTSDGVNQDGTPTSFTNTNNNNSVVPDCEGEEEPDPPAETPRYRPAKYIGKKYKFQPRTF